MSNKEDNKTINVPKTFTNYESKDGESSDFGMLWEGVIQPTKIESFEQDGKPTHLIVQTPPSLTNKIFIIKK